MDSERSTGEEAGRAELKKQNELLAGQVKRLVRTESELYKVQEQLDTQIRIYHRLYESGKKLNATYDLDEIAQIATHFVLYELNLQRCVIFMRDPTDDQRLVVRGADGYYDEDLAQRVTTGVLRVDDRALDDVWSATEQIAVEAIESSPTASQVIYVGRGSIALRSLGRQYALDEFVVRKLGAESSFGLLMAGNSLENAQYQTRVRENSQLVMGLANLATQVSTAITNALNYQALEDERSLLEQKVDERTRELSEANDNLKRLDQLKTQFFANVSHELRTPLTLSTGPLEILLGDKSHPESTTRSLRTIYTNQLRLLKLISELLDFAKLEAGKMTARFRREEVVGALKYYVGTLQSAAEGRGIALDVVAPPHAVDLFVDRDKFEKIVMNLLSNAFKFTPDGGRINVRVEAGQDAVKIHVEDTGIGIDDSQQATIFERFSQVDASTKRRYSGTGIGLAMVKEYMQLHAGEVTVESYPGRGSRFTLTFLAGREHIAADALEDELASQVEGLCPYQMVEFDAEGDEDLDESLHDTETAEHDAQAAEQFDVESTTGAKNRIAEIKDLLLLRTRVLVVDDNKQMRSFLAELLRPHYRVHLARNGAEGLEVAQKIFPDLIISDVMMPIMSGHELCQAVKQDRGRLGRTPVILLTAQAEMTMKLEGLEIGADDYLVKPFNAEELLSRASNLIKARRQERELFVALRNLEEKDQVLREDLQQAQAFQQSILPSMPHSERVQFSAAYLPAEMVGGDLYAIHELSADKFRVFVADATGHGIQASLRTMVIKSEYERLALTVDDPGQLLTDLNEQIVSTHGGLGLRFTACCFDVEAPLGAPIVLCYANGGHPPITHVRPGQEPREIYRPAPFLGMVSGISLESTKQVLLLGDRLFGYSDGLFEQWAGDIEFGHERMLVGLARPGTSLADVVDGTVASLREFVGQEGLGDDLTLVGVEV